MGRPNKHRTAHKTLRLTDQAHHAVEVFAPLEGQSGNAFISAAVEAYAKVQSKKHGLNMAALWHADESVRDLRLFLLGEYPFDGDQSVRAKFVMLHRDFFYVRDDDGIAVRERNAVELYPLLDKWRAAKGDHWAPGRAMAAHLNARGLPAPVWPPEGES